jgi:[acyl-carrier-protein] S-malonyltransferase
MTIEFADRIANCAFAFRGYNVTNLGRSAELLLHPVYGSVVEEELRRTSEIMSDSLSRQIDLVHRIGNEIESTLESFPEDIGIITCMELAQMRLLEEFFGVDWKYARLAFGYSLGEVTALIAAKVYAIEDILPTPLLMADDCVALARDVSMGVLFSRGPELNLDAVRRLCQQINCEGQGMISVSSYLSPNTVLLMGQRDTVDRFKSRMHDVLPKPVHLRKNKNRWPPLHTPILWQRQLVDQAKFVIQTMQGGFIKPEPTLISLVTGRASYNDYNSREILGQWIDHPQRLWDAICETLAAGVETVIHVGPEPNLVPATFKRLSDNIAAQLKGRTPNRLGLRAMARLTRSRTWLNNLLPSRAALLRAPFVQHVILEDWLLEQDIEKLKRKS